MKILLLAIIYIAFIGLGLPDSLFGTSWPQIYVEFNLPIALESVISITVSLGTIISSLLSSKLISKLGTGKLTAFSTLLTALGLIGFSFSPNIYVMIILAIPLGIGAGAIDIVLNNYVALHYSSSQMNFLHCFYGIGVSISPYILSLVLKDEGGWRNGYRIVFIVQLCISLLLLFTLPLWNKVRDEKMEREESYKPLSIRETLRIKGVKYMCALFFIICTIECVCSHYGSTYLVEYKGLEVDEAALGVLLFFVGMAVGRFLSGVLATKLHSWTIVDIGVVALFIAIVLLIIPGSKVLSFAGLFLVGFGNGPLFPNFNYLAPISFGKEVSQSVISLQMSFAYAGIMIGPLVCGLLGQYIGMVIFPYYLLLFFILLLLFIFLVRKVLKREGK